MATFIEQVVLDYLKTKITDVPVSFEKLPSQREAGSFILLERVGGKSDKFINSASFAIQSYAPSLMKAAQLNLKVVEAMNDLDQLDQISKIECDSSYNFTDPETKEYRYQAVFDILYF